MNVTETAVDDPDVAFYENYVCGAQRNYTGYCNPEVDKLVDQQSAETEYREAQKAGVGDREEADRGRRPPDPVLHTRPRTAAARSVKGLTTMVNSIYNQSASRISGSNRAVGSSAAAK